MKKVFLPILGVMIFIVVVGLFTQKTQGGRFSLPFSKPASSELENLKTITIKGKEIKIEVADNNAGRQKGLSGRADLPENQGMLFVFDKKDTLPSFWMKDMQIPLDIIWINDGKVEQIDKNVQPEPGTPDNKLKIYTPNKPIDYVLEVNAGYSNKNGLAVGDFVEGLPSEPF